MYQEGFNRTISVLLSPPKHFGYHVTVL
ncbi:hypothetical protein Avbf_15091 [Armadillidium vulgare]|nr:hypothetical protein Avbf_15091 [Armadillidium vulgare]